MTKEQKDLLLKDLSARLLYGVKLNMKGLIGVSHHTTILYGKNTEIYFRYACNDYFIDEVKPYLFPLSSMTEEQKEEFNTKSLELQLKVIDDEIMYEKATEFQVDFYNKHHLDWRGLIPMGLAIDATGLNIY